MSNNKGSYIWRLIGVLLLIGLMIGGGVMAYRAGVAQGIARAPEVAEALSSAAESGDGLSFPAYGYGYPVHRMRPHFGFFPFGGIFRVHPVYLPVLWVDALDLPPLGLALWSHARTRSLEGIRSPLGTSTLGV